MHHAENWTGFAICTCNIEHKKMNKIRLNMSIYEEH